MTQRPLSGHMTVSERAEEPKARAGWRHLCLSWPQSGLARHIANFESHCAASGLGPASEPYW
jgi:hypothetical protein